MQPRLAVVVLPRQPEVVLDRADRPHGRLAERLVVALPYDCPGGRKDKGDATLLVFSHLR